MEDCAKQPLAADASLYNGRPLDTSPACHSTGLTSRTLSTPDSRNGVSVENVPDAPKQWYVLRVSYGRTAKAKEAIESKGIECYAPLRYKQITKRGKKRIITDFLLPSFIFVHSSSEQIETLLHDDRVNSIEGRPLLSFYFDHTSYRSDAPDRNPPLTIRDNAMSNFIRLTSIKNPNIIPVTSNNIQYKLGDRVVVTEGDFNGVYGRVARIAGQQRVIVELFSGCLVATAYVPTSALLISKT